MFASLSARYQKLGLSTRIATALISGVLLVGMLVGAASFLLMRHQVIASTEARLAAQALLQQREIEQRLVALLTQAQSLANNTLTANGLADSAGRDAYLQPLMHHYELPWPRASLLLLNYRGEPIARSAAEVALENAAKRAFRGMLDSDKAHAAIDKMTDGSYVGAIAVPVVYRLTNATEGAVLLQFDPAELALTDGGDDWALYDASGVRLAGKVPAKESIELRAPLALPAPLSELGLTYALSADPQLALRNLTTIIAAYIGAGLLIIYAAIRFSRSIADILSAPIRNLVVAAESISASGRPTAHAPLGNDEESNRLARAFNAMVDRLAQSYAELEMRVQARTKDLTQARLAAEKASKLLQEAVSSVAQGFTIYDEEDRLVLCNDAYLEFYSLSRDLIVPGATFEEIVRVGMHRGQYAEAMSFEDREAWVRQRVAQHRAANGQVLEQHLGDGRWLLIVEYRTPSGYIVGNRIDITQLKQTAEALRQRELYLRATLDNIPFLFWLKDTDSRFLAVNKAFADACGRNTAEEVVGLSDFDVWPRELAFAYRTDDLAVMHERREKMVEEPLGNGADQRWIETYKKPVIAEDGALFGTVGFARDITERKSMEQELAASRERWRLAVAGANDGIWDWNLLSGTMFYSARWKSMLGYLPQDIGDSPDEWSTRIHPEDRDRIMGAVQAHLRGETEFYESELRIRCKDGSYKWILCRGRASFDADGKAARMAGSHTDMTERRHYEDALIDRTEQLNAIFELSPDGFISFDAAHRIKYSSPAFTRITGLEQKSVLGLDEASFSDLLTAHLAPGASFHGFSGLRGPTSEAHPRVLLDLATPARRVLEMGLRRSKTNSVSQILYFRDVTREVEIDRMKSEFLSTAAHELRTPMASVYGFSELLLARDFDEATRRDLIETIHRNADLMSSIINELLDLARIEARRGKDFVFAPLQLQDLIQHAVTAYKPPSGRDAPVIEFPATPLWIRADARKMEQALGNVLSNAYKYSPDGGAVRISIAEQHSVGQVTEYGLRVTDAGIGMKPEQVARVCERFYRADTSGSIPGTGLGMSIVSEIIGLHAGRIAISSAPAQGTEVTLWLPAGTAPKTSTQAQIT